MRDTIVPVPSTWPWTRWPPRRSSSRTERSRLTAAPGVSAPRLERVRVSRITSAVNVPPAWPETVRQTPLTAMESPPATSPVTWGPRTVSRAASPRSSTATTSPSSSTMPVNIRVSLLGALAPGDARAVTRVRRGRLTPTACVLPPIRTLTVGPGISPDQPNPLTGLWVADCHRRFGVSPTPEHALYCLTFCHTSYSAAIAPYVTSARARGHKAGSVDGVDGVDGATSLDMRVISRILLVASSAATL